MRLFTNPHDDDDQGCQRRNADPGCRRQRKCHCTLTVQIQIGRGYRLFVQIYQLIRLCRFSGVVCPIGSGSDYHSYNVNADDAACAIATAMKASKLAFLTDIEGVYRNPLDRTSLISSLTISEAEALLESGNVGGGMLPKIQNCVDAVKAGVGKVHILDGRMEHSLLLEFFTKTGIGTVITGEKEEAHE